MHPKLFASLYETIETWVETEGQSMEWQLHDFWTPIDIALFMSKASEVVFDSVVHSSQETEANLSE